MEKTDSKKINEIKEMIMNFRKQEDSLYEGEDITMYQYLVYRIEKLVNEEN